MAGTVVFPQKCKEIRFCCEVVSRLETPRFARARFRAQTRFKKFRVWRLSKKCGCDGEDNDDDDFATNQIAIDYSR